MSERRRTGWIVSFGGLRVEVSHPFHDQTVKWMGHPVFILITASLSEVQAGWVCSEGAGS